MAPQSANEWGQLGRGGPGYDPGHHDTSINEHVYSSKNDRKVNFFPLCVQYSNTVG